MQATVGVRRKAYRPSKAEREAQGWVPPPKEEFVTEAFIPCVSVWHGDVEEARRIAREIRRLAPSAIVQLHNVHMINERPTSREPMEF